MFAFFTPEINHMIDADYELVKKQGYGRLVIPKEMHSLRMESISDPDTLSVISELHEAGYKVWLVGGCVRDYIIGMEHVDYDLVSNITVDQAHEFFGERYSTHSARGLTFGEVEGKGDAVDIAPLQPFPEAYLHGNIIPEDDPQSLFNDSMERDLPINALYFDPFSGDIIDFHAGLKCIRDGVINTVFNDPEVQFCHDSNSVLRVLRFTAKYGFTMTRKVRNALNAVGRKCMQAIEPHILYKNAIKLFYSGNAAATYALLKQYNVQDVIIASLALAEDPAEYDHYLIHLMAILDRMDIRGFGNKHEYRAFVYTSLYLPRYLEHLKYVGAKEAARLTIDEAFKVISVPESTEKLLLEYLPCYLESIEDRNKARFFRSIGALMY